MESILDSVKTLLGIQTNDYSFDKELVMHINSALMSLYQSACGLQDFEIKSAKETWSDFIDNSTLISLAKQYIFLKVRIAFDPPQSSVLLDALQKQLSEYEWRLNVEAEPYALSIEEALEEDEEDI